MFIGLYLSDVYIYIYICIYIYIPMYVLIKLLRMSETNEDPISSHIWVASSTFKQLLSLKKNQKILKQIFMTILGLVKSFKTLNRPGPNRPRRSLMDYFLESIKPSFKSPIYAIKIWDRYH